MVRGALLQAGKRQFFRLRPAWQHRPGCYYSPAARKGVVRKSLQTTTMERL